jgi:hypothetical protein
LALDGGDTTTINVNNINVPQTARSVNAPSGAPARRTG